MKKFFVLLTIILLFCINGETINANIDVSGGSSGVDTSSCGSYNGCWYNQNDMGLRLTFVDSSGTILPGTYSYDYFSTNSGTDKRKIVEAIRNKSDGYNTTYYKKYKNGGSDSVIGDARIDFKGVSYAIPDGNRMPYSLSSIETLLSDELLDRFVKDSQAEGKYTFEELQIYYILIEPIYAIGYKNGSTYEYKMGTATEITTFLTNTYLEGLSQAFMLNAAYNMHLTETKIGFTAVESLTTKFPDDKIAQADKKTFIADVANNQNGYGVLVVEVSNVRKIIYEEENYEYTCPINVSINNCENPSITEPNTKECLVYNSLYSYESSCNIYCSDIITTDFNGFYNTFIKEGVKNNAIYSGRYMAIKDSPKITITKTCYQSESKEECSDWKNSLKLKIESDYKNKRSEIKLNVDNNTYTLFDIIQDDSISKTDDITDKVVYEIKYAHKMDPNINKYISIETGKDVFENLDKYRDAVIVNNNPYGTIITQSGNGGYQYYVDLSGTELNKYISGSTKLSDVIVSNYSTKSTSESGNNTTITTYTYKQNNTINFTINNTNKDEYNSSNLNFNCEYVKANPCICPINTVCDPVTCEPVQDSPCECNSECGCMDNKTCDPIPCNDTKCDPTKEFCFVYRPISLTNPFPGIAGSNRNPGNNWNGVLRDKDGNLMYYKGSITSLSDYYIKYNRGYNDYELYREAEPLYVIKLDANKIKAIREYNDYKNHDYSDSDLECDNGKNCISKFLRGRADGFTINLLEDNTISCHNITHSTFDSCIKRKGA